MTAPRWVLQGFAAVAALACALAVWALSLPHQMTYAEGYMLEQAVRLADGGGLYQDPQARPWIVDNFPPLWIAVLAGGVELFGAQFAFGRLLTMAATVGLGALLWSFQRRRGESAWLAAGVVALWLMSPFLVRRMLIMRMDLPALAFAALGMWLLLARRERRWSTAAAALAFTAAVFSRQTALVAPAAAVLGLWFSGKRQRAVHLAAFTAGLVAVGVVWLQAWTDGRFLLDAVVHNTGRWEFRKVVRFTGLFMVGHVLLLGLGAIGVWRQWQGGMEARVLATWCALEAVVLFTIGKPGTASNHFLPLIFVLALHAAPGIRWTAGRLRERGRVSWDAGRVVAAVLVVQALVVAVPLGAGIVHALDVQEEEAALVALLAQEEGPILCENAGALLQSGHEVVFEPRTTREQHLAGRWDDTALVAAVEAQNFTLIITETFPDYREAREGMRLTKGTWQAIQDNYERAEEVGRWQVWRPKEPALMM